MARKQELFTWDLYESEKGLHLTLKDMIQSGYSVISVVVTNYTPSGRATAAIIVLK